MSEGELDILITRVVDGRASHEDWRRLEALAGQDAGVWRDLAQAQRDDQILRRAVGMAVGVAASVELPAPVAHEAHRARFQVGERTRRVAMWGGWAAAALVTLAFVSKQPPGGTPQQANTGGPILSAADALSKYIAQGQREGRVINEMPDKVLVNTQPLADGQGYDVVYFRLIMERDRVPDLYRFSSDELGQPVPVRVVIPQISTNVTNPL
ncbi:hypothetical protein PHYC_03319 [Phycisphaerales bacterium]|nr:hypothetical protein PHYC_03319 [Phycisphaerales bacterium]